MKQYYENKEHYSEQRKQYYIENRDKILEKQHIYYENNTGKIKTYAKDYYQRNTERITEKNKSWLENNRDGYREWKTSWQREKRNSDLHFKIRGNLSSRIRQAVKNKYGGKAALTMDLIGCTVEELCTFLEAEFEDGMTWENMGEWHIDHIRPCASFNLEDPEEQQKCFHWTNLQPLWARDNLSKGAKIV